MWPCLGKFQRRKLVWTTMKQKQTHIKDWSNGDWKHWTCNISMIKIMLIKLTYCLEKHYRTGSSQEIKVNQQWTIEIMHVILKVTMDLLINCKIPYFVIFSWHDINCLAVETSIFPFLNQSSFIFAKNKWVFTRKFTPCKPRRG